MVSHPLDKLGTYRRKRDFSRTGEPPGDEPEGTSGRLYVIQKHAARHLHYDLRLELNGVLISWAVPKGPSLDPEDKRLAIQVEDHPLEYGSFEGVIPEGEYGGGTVMLWDRGEWEPLGDAQQGYRKGRLSFLLHGEKLQGHWTLTRLARGESGEERSWLLIKKRDAHARPQAEYDIVRSQQKSVASGRSLEEIARAGDLVWMGGSASIPDAIVSSREQAVPAPDPSRLAGAQPAAMPKTFKPQLALAVQQAPRGEEWLHEIKFDGYRMLCMIDQGRVRFLSRNGEDWTERFRGAVSAAASLPVEQAILDGEMVVLDEGGISDFQALQNLLRHREERGLVYYVFDLPYCQGYDLTRVPLLERKALLRRFIPPASENGILRYSDHFSGHGERVLRQACRLALEGVVSKRAGSAYQQKRSPEWRKVKCLNRQEFVIGGYTEPGGARSGLGALLLGHFEPGGTLVFCGRVGTGFSEEVLRDLRERLERIEQSRPPFINPPVGSEARGAHWVRPELVAEVEFTAWTRDGRLRHPSFKGLREDKKATEVRREEPAPAPDRQMVEPGGRAQTRLSGITVAETPEVAGVRLSNPERVLYPGLGVNKLELARYYEKVANYAVPHLAGRPLTLVRCPRGHEKKCFYQKHFADALPDFAHTVSIREKKGEGLYIVIDDLRGLVSLVQLGVLEFHPWASREDRIEQPDQMVYDLDPDPGVAWERVIEGAFEVRRTLEELGLQSFVKTSGGKGLHVVVPLLRRSGWDEVKTFARAVAERIVRRRPERYVATMTKSKRQGKIFIDHFRNSRGATSVAAYSTRARPGAPVSTPIGWEELAAGIGPDTFTIANLPVRLAALESDPWREFSEVRQSLTQGMKKTLRL